MNSNNYINQCIEKLEQELMELEEEHCDFCTNQFNISLCEECDVKSRKTDLEMQIASMRGDT